MKAKHLGRPVRRISVKEGVSKQTKRSTIVITKLRKRGSRSKRRQSISGNRLLGFAQKNVEEYIKHTQATEAVQALLQLIENVGEADSKLFGDEPQPILMQVGAVRVPQAPSWRLRFKLPHPVITDTTDVCIFVHNVAKKDTKNLDRTINHYKERFAKEGISQISQVIPLKQIKTEYSQYEQKRRLCRQFDVFLSDVRISHRVALRFGKFFKYSLKTPVPVRVDVDNLKEEIDNALSKATMQIHGKGDSFIVQVGHTKQPVKAVVQNMCFVAAGLSREFPGGWDNVSTVYIKTANSMAVPVYVSLKSPNDVPVPVVKPKRPKNAAPIEGELSTRVGYIARMYAGGRVVLEKDKSQDSDIEWSDDDWETEWRNFENKVFLKEDIRRSERELDQKTEEKPEKKTGKKMGKEDSDVEVKDDDQVEEDIAEAEDSYLQQWKRERDEVNEKKKKTIQRENTDEGPKIKKVKYVAGEMSLGRLGNATRKKPKTSASPASGGMVHTAFQELKSKINRKKLSKKQKTAQNKSIVCSNKSSKKQKKKGSKGKNKKKS